VDKEEDKFCPEESLIIFTDKSSTLNSVMQSIKAKKETNKYLTEPERDPIRKIEKKSLQKRKNQRQEAFRAKRGLRMLEETTESEIEGRISEQLEEKLEYSQEQLKRSWMQA
jgi:hypothetical protein